MAVDDNYVYTYLEDSVAALSKTDGKAVWTYYNRDIDLYAYYYTYISIDDEHLCFTTSMDPDSISRLTVLNKLTGAFLWDHKFERITEPVIANGLVYVIEWGSDSEIRTLWGFDIDTGKTVFQDNKSLYFDLIVSDHKLISGIENGIKIFYNAPETGMKYAEQIPLSFSLNQNFPNPFNPVTKIRFSLPEPSEVDLAVYDLLGRKVKTLIREKMDSGKHSVDFNGSDLPSGVYIYKIKASGSCLVRKMLLLK